MQRSLLFYPLLALLCFSGSKLFGQCTVVPNGQYPAGNVALNTDNTPTILSDLCYCGEYSRCTGVVSGKSYTVTSSVATDFITITNGNGNNTIAWGTQPLTFTTTANAIRVYRHVSSLCESEDEFRTITVSCNNCAVPPANDACSAATNLTPTAGTFTAPGAQTSVNATSSGISIPTCSGFASLSALDVWYKFTTKAAGGNETFVITPTGFDAIVEALSGSCGALSSLGCIDDGTTGGAETLVLTGLAGSTTYYLRVYGYDGETGTFSIAASGTALPLELAYFTGKAVDQGNQLAWETVTEKNVRCHIVDRSPDGRQWKEVGRLAGQPYSTEARQYVFEDRDPLLKAYYRLRSVDFDGEESKSNVILLTRKGDHFGIASVFPSPTVDDVTVQFVSLREETVNVRVTDMTGRVVLSQPVAAAKELNELRLPSNGLQAGVYTVTVINADGVSTPVRFIRQ